MCYLLPFSLRLPHSSFPLSTPFSPASPASHIHQNALAVAPSATTNAAKRSGLGLIYAGGRFSINGDPYTRHEIQKLQLHAAKVSEVQVVETSIPVVNEVQTIDLGVSWRHGIQEIETSAHYVPEVQQVLLDAPRVPELVRVNLLGRHVDEVQSFTVADTYVSEIQAVRLCKDDQFAVLTGSFDVTISQAKTVAVDASAADMKAALESMRFVGAGSILAGASCTSRAGRCYHANASSPPPSLAPPSPSPSQSHHHNTRYLSRMEHHVQWSVGLALRTR